MYLLFKIFCFFVAWNLRFLIVNVNKKCVDIKYFLADPRFSELIISSIL